MAVTDLQNGGGVSCAVVGTGNISVQYYDPETGWVLLGSRSGSGTVTGTTSRPGVFWWAAYTATEISLLSVVAVTRAASAIYDLCLQAVADTIAVGIAADPAGLGFLQGVSRQRKLRVDAMEDNLPAAVVIPSNPTMEPITNERDQLTYPCTVVVIDTESPQADDDEAALVPYHLINERIRRLFSQQRLAGVNQVDVCRVQIGNYLEWQQMMYDGVQSVTIVNCLAREYRGI